MAWKSQKQVSTSLTCEPQSWSEPVNAVSAWTHKNSSYDNYTQSFLTNFKPFVCFVDQIDLRYILTTLYC